MLIKSGDLIPVKYEAINIHWTKRRSQVLNFLHRGSVTFQTYVYDSNVGDISPLSAYFNPYIWSVEDLNNKFGIHVERMSDEDNSSSSSLDRSQKHGQMLEQATFTVGDNMMLHSSSVSPGGSSSSSGVCSLMGEVTSTNKMITNDNKPFGQHQSKNEEKVALANGLKEEISSLLPKLLIYPELVQTCQKPSQCYDIQSSSPKYGDYCDQKNNIQGRSKVTQGQALKLNSQQPISPPQVIISNHDVVDNANSYQLLSDRLSALIASRRHEQRRTPSLPDWIGLATPLGSSAATSANSSIEKSILSKIISSARVHAAENDAAHNDHFDNNNQEFVNSDNDVFGVNCNDKQTIQPKVSRSVSPNDLLDWKSVVANLKSGTSSNNSSNADWKSGKQDESGGESTVDLPENGVGKSRNKSPDIDNSSISSALTQLAVSYAKTSPSSSANNSLLFTSSTQECLKFPKEAGDNVATTKDQSNSHNRGPWPQSSSIRNISAFMNNIDFRSTGPRSASCIPNEAVFDFDLSLHQQSKGMHSQAKIISSSANVSPNASSSKPLSSSGVTSPLGGLSSYVTHAIKTTLLNNNEGKKAGVAAQKVKFGQQVNTVKFVGTLV